MAQGKPISTSSATDSGGAAALAAADVHALLAELLQSLSGDAVVAVVSVDPAGRNGRTVAVRGAAAPWPAASFAIGPGTGISEVSASTSRIVHLGAGRTGLPVPRDVEERGCACGCLAEVAGHRLIGLVFGSGSGAPADDHDHALLVTRELARCLVDDGVTAGGPGGALKDLAERLAASVAAVDTVPAAGRAMHAHFAMLLQQFERERESLGRSLQDSVMQSLSALKFGLEHSSALLEHDNVGGAMRVIRGLVEQLRALIDEVRTLGFNARPPLLDDAGAVSAVQWLCREWADLHPDTRLDLECGLVNEHIPDALKLPVFRTVQVALDNVARHARAPRVIVALNRNDSQLEVDIMDEGVGFHAESAPPPGALGLMCLNERVCHSGGTTRVLSRPGRGTIVQARWPLQPHHESHHHA